MIKDKRFTLPIYSIKEETKDVRTFSFRSDIRIKPGQFIMLTDFKGGEKPFSVSDYSLTDSGSFFSVTIKRVGAFTSRLFTLKVGDIVSFRGAYGSSFFIPGESRINPTAYTVDPQKFKPVLCGGGFGLPPLYLLAKNLLQAGVLKENIKIIAAGRTENDLLFEERFLSLGLSYIGVTEIPYGEDVKRNNSRITGTAAKALSSMSDMNFVYASGPDLMMKSLIPLIPQVVEYQFLFERYMKCAIGICGSCVSDPTGIRICKEGPALWRVQIEKMEDFGVYRRTASGSIEKFKNRLK